VRLPEWLQALTVRLLRANVLFFPWGSFYLPGFPRAVPVTVLAARPIPVPAVAEPSDEQVAILHRRYMGQMLEAFDRHKERCGHGDNALAFVPPLEPLAERDFAREWETACLLGTPGKRRPPRSDGNHGEALMLGLIFAHIFARGLFSGDPRPVA